MLRRIAVIRNSISCSQKISGNKNHLLYYHHRFKNQRKFTTLKPSEKTEALKEWLMIREPPNNLMHVLGFVSNILGFGAFIWTLYTHFNEQKRDFLRQQDRQFRQDIKDAELIIRDTDPRKIISKLRKALAEGNDNRETLFSLVFQRRNQMDKLADHWIDALEKNEDWALRVDSYRTTLKRMWFVVMKACDLDTDAPSIEVQEKMNALLYDTYPLGVHVAQATLLLTEPLDMAAHRARVKENEEEDFDWNVQRPRLYRFIRQTYDIADDWPFNAESDTHLVQRPSLRVSTDAVPVTQSQPVPAEPVPSASPPVQGPEPAPASA